MVQVRNRVVAQGHRARKCESQNATEAVWFHSLHILHVQAQYTEVAVQFTIQPRTVLSWENRQKCRTFPGKSGHLVILDLWPL